MKWKPSGSHYVFFLGSGILFKKWKQAFWAGVYYSWERWVINIVGLNLDDRLKEKFLKTRMVFLGTLGTWERNLDLDLDRYFTGTLVINVGHKREGGKSFFFSFRNVHLCTFFLHYFIFRNLASIHTYLDIRSRIAFTHPGSIQPSSLEIYHI